MGVEGARADATAGPGDAREGVPADDLAELGEEPAGQDGLLRAQVDRRAVDAEAAALVEDGDPVVLAAAAGLQGGHAGVEIGPARRAPHPVLEGVHADRWEVGWGHDEQAGRAAVAQGGKPGGVIGIVEQLDDVGMVTPSGAKTLLNRVAAAQGTAKLTPACAT